LGSPIICGKRRKPVSGSWWFICIRPYPSWNGCILLFPLRQKNGKGSPFNGVAPRKPPPILALWVSVFFRLASGRCPFRTNDCRRFVGKCW
jgi:hypothetical protein